VDFFDNVLYVVNKGISWTSYMSLTKAFLVYTSNFWG